MVLELPTEKGGERLKNNVNVDKVIELRKEHHLTQREMAVILGVSTITYSQKEQRVINFTVSDLIKLKQHFKVNVNNLLG